MRRKRMEGGTTPQGQATPQSQTNSQNQTTCLEKKITRRGRLSHDSRGEAGAGTSRRMEKSWKPSCLRSLLRGPCEAQLRGGSG